VGEKYDMGWVVVRLRCARKITSIAERDITFEDFFRTDATDTTKLPHANIKLCVADDRFRWHDMTGHT